MTLNYIVLLHTHHTPTYTHKYVRPSVNPSIHTYTHKLIQIAPDHYLTRIHNEYDVHNYNSLYSAQSCGCHDSLYALPAVSGTRNRQDFTVKLLQKGAREYQQGACSTCVRTWGTALGSLCASTASGNGCWMVLRQLHIILSIAVGLVCTIWFMIGEAEILSQSITDISNNRVVFEEFMFSKHQGLKVVLLSEDLSSPSPKV